MQESDAAPPASSGPRFDDAEDDVGQLLRMQAEALRADGKAAEAALLLGWAALYAARAR